MKRIRVSTKRTSRKQGVWGIWSKVTRFQVTHLPLRAQYATATGIGLTLLMQVLKHFLLDLWQHSVPLTERIASSLFHAGGGQCDQQGLAEAGDLFHIIKTTLYEHRRWRRLLLFSCKLAQQIEAENFSQVRTTKNTSLWLYCLKSWYTVNRRSNWKRSATAFRYGNYGSSHGHP